MTSSQKLLRKMDDRTRRIAEVITEYQSDPSDRIFTCRLDGKGYVVQKTDRGYAVEEHPSLTRAEKRMQQL